MAGSIFVVSACYLEGKLDFGTAVYLILILFSLNLKGGFYGRSVVLRYT